MADPSSPLETETPSHTPGPWSFKPPSKHRDAEDIPVMAEGVGEIALVRDLWNKDGGRAGAEANARLVAAAPDMLAELLDCPCPRPANAAPDDLAVKGCLERDECGCGRGAAAAKALGQKTAGERWNKAKRGVSQS